MKMLVILLTVLVVISSCSNDNNQLYESIEFEKPTILANLQAKLQENKIYYKMEHSKLLYRYMDRVVVDKLIWKAIYEAYPSNRYTNSDEKYFLMFKSILDDRAIAFSVVVEGSRKYIVWKEEDNSKVQSIRDEILLLQSDGDIKSAIIKHETEKHSGE